MKLCIFGAGYVGLTNALVLSNQGHEVLVVEKNEEKLRMLCSRLLPFHEPFAQALLERHTDNLRFASQYEAGCQVAFICVDTPYIPLSGYDVSGVFSCAAQAWDAQIVVRSTVSPGTCRALAQTLGRGVCYMPEFLTQADAVEGVLHPERIIIGCACEADGQTLCALYEKQTIIRMGLEDAELCKLSCNAYLALRVSYINQLANLCECVGAQYEQVAKGMGADSRIGGAYLAASCGYGGSCLPKDVHILMECARQNQSDFVMLGATMAANERQKMRLEQKARRYYASFSGLRVAVLGASFKEGSDDLRNSVALELIEELVKQGAQVQVYDPLCAARVCKRYARAAAFADAAQALQGASICFVLHKTHAIAALCPGDFAVQMQTPLVIDAKRCFDAKSMEEAGVAYEAIGIAQNREK